MVIRGGIQCGLRILWTICLCDSLIRGAKKEETQRVEQLLQSTSIKPDFIGLITPFDDRDVPENFLGNLHQVPDIIDIYKINEIIF